MREAWGVDTLKPLDGGQGAGADLRALEPLRDPVGVQMICRAILFRLGAAAIAFDGRNERFGVEVAAYQPVVQVLGTA